MSDDTHSGGPDPDEEAAASGDRDDDGDPAAGSPGELRATAADDRVRVQALTVRLRQLETLVAELVDHSPSDTEPEDSGSAGSGPPEPAAGTEPVPAVFACVADFVTGYFAPLFDRPTRGGRWRWCPQWFEHGEAVSRFAGLWQAWEAMHAQGGTALGLWYRDHLDHQLPILLGPDGPFRGCAEQHWPTPDTDRLTVLTPPPDNRVWETA